VTSSHHVNINFRELREQCLTESNQERNVRDQFRDYATSELKSYCDANSLPFWVCALNVLGELNTGTMIRSAHLWGAERVVIFGRCKTDNRGQVGAAHYTTVERVWAMDAQGEIVSHEFVKFCELNQVAPIFVEQDGDHMFEFDWVTHVQDLHKQHLKPMLVMGTEHSGVPDHILSLKHELRGAHVSIPQKGVVRSHNVSMAFAQVICHMMYRLGWYVA
jgi:tRNA G18 (ribose-2'-O)-methylase SpoU